MKGIIKKEKEELVDPFILYAREIHVNELEEDKIKLSKTSKISIGVSDKGIVAIDEDNSTHILTNPAFIGNEKYNCGLFIPFNPSYKTLKFISNEFMKMCKKIEDEKEID